jgi:hypothetical protein
MMMTSEHFIKLYSCGHVYAQCRCPSLDKRKEYLDYPCVECMQKLKVGDK